MKAAFLKTAGFILTFVAIVIGLELLERVIPDEWELLVFLGIFAASIAFLFKSYVRDQRDIEKTYEVQISVGSPATVSWVEHTDKMRDLEGKLLLMAGTNGGFQQIATKLGSNVSEVNFQILGTNAADAKRAAMSLTCLAVNMAGVEEVELSCENWDPRLTSTTK